MDWPTFDKNQIALLKRRAYKEVEQQLLDVYRTAAETNDKPTLAEAAGRLAQHYASPIAEDFSKASVFFDKAEKADPSVHWKLHNAWFQFHILRNPALALDKIDEILVQGNAPTDQCYSALVLKGQCLLALNRLDEVSFILGQLSSSLQNCADRLFVGDAFNLVKDLIAKRYLLAECARFLDVILHSPVSQRTKEGARALRENLRNQ